MQKMTSEERVAYIAGIVEGLAQARHAKDGKRSTGSGCIYNWFYKEKGTQEKIYAGFRRYPNAMPGDIVRILSTTKCGV